MGSAIFVLDDVGCDVDGVWELAVVTGANVDTAAVEEAAEQLSQPCTCQRRRDSERRHVMAHKWVESTPVLCKH